MARLCELPVVLAALCLLVPGGFANTNDEVVSVECSPEAEAVMGMLHTWGPYSPSLWGMGSFDCAMDGAGNTPLHLVASYAASDPYREGSLTMLARHIIGAGGRPAAPNFGGETALHIAASECSPGVAAVLLSMSGGAGATDLVHMVDNAGYTALDGAVGHFCTKAARTLLGYRAPLTPDHFLDRCNDVLVSSVIRGRASDLNETLIAYAGNASLPSANCTVPWDRLGRSLLHLAVASADLMSSQERLGVIEVLVEHGANSTAPDGNGEAALAIASRLDRVDVGDLLLRVSPEAVNATDNQNRTALHAAGMVGARSSTRLLLANGAPADLRDNSGLTALDYAERAGHHRVASAIRNAVEHPPGSFVYQAPAGSSHGPDEFQVASEAGGTGSSVDVVAVICGTIAGVIFIGALSFCVIHYVYKRVSKERLTYLQGNDALPDGPDEIKWNHGDQVSGQMVLSDARFGTHLEKPVMDPVEPLTLPGAFKEAQSNEKPLSYRSGKGAPKRDAPASSSAVVMDLDGTPKSRTSAGTTTTPSQGQAPLSPAERQQKMLEEAKQRSEERARLRAELRQQEREKEKQQSAQPSNAPSTGQASHPTTPGSRASTLSAPRTVASGGGGHAGDRSARSSSSGGDVRRALQAFEEAPTGPSTPVASAREDPMSPKTTQASRPAPPPVPAPRSSAAAEARRIAEERIRASRGQSSSTSPSPAAQLRQQRALLNTPTPSSGHTPAARQAAHQRQSPSRAGPRQSVI